MHAILIHTINRNYKKENAMKNKVEKKKKSCTRNCSDKNTTDTKNCGGSRR